MPPIPNNLHPTFFYDAQIRRFLIQFARIFSNFSVEYGRNEEGTNHTLVRVPVRYGDSSRNAQTVLQDNSASKMPATPLMTFYVSGLDYDRPRIQEPYFIDTINVRQRSYDRATNTFETTQGSAFTIDRPMPVPYKLTMKLDIWTSNTNQKMQLLEQILVLFNPSLEIQGTDNFIDWTSLSIVELVSTQWSSRMVPTGTEDPIDIATLTFALPIWISSPVKVKKLGVVERIIASVYDGSGDLVNAISDNDLLLGTRQVITPYGYQVLLIGNKLQALRQPQTVNPPNSSLSPPVSPPSNLYWSAIIEMYGVLRPGISIIRLEQLDGSEIIGTVSYDPTDDRFMLFTIDPDTLPGNTLLPINAVIDPLISGPGYGLPVATSGQRYLLIEPTGSSDSSAVAWQGTGGQPLIANANDIIEYNGVQWLVSFNSELSSSTEYVTNITTEIQYRWDGVEWTKSYEGLYPGSKWSIML